MPRDMMQPIPYLRDYTLSAGLMQTGSHDGRPSFNLETGDSSLGLFPFLYLRLHNS